MSCADTQQWYVNQAMVDICSHASMMKTTAQLIVYGGAVGSLYLIAAVIAIVLLASRVPSRIRAMNRAYAEMVAVLSAGEDHENAVMAPFLAMSDLFAYLIPSTGLLGAIGIQVWMNGFGSVLSSTLPAALLSSLLIMLVECAIADIWLGTLTRASYKGVGGNPSEMPPHGILSILFKTRLKYGLMGLTWVIGWTVLLVFRRWP